MNIVAIYYTIKHPVYQFSFPIKAFWDHSYEGHNQSCGILELVRMRHKSSISNCTIKITNLGQKEKCLDVSQIMSVINNT